MKKLDAFNIQHQISFVFLNDLMAVLFLNNNLFCVLWRERERKISMGEGNVGEWAKRGPM